MRIAADHLTPGGAVVVKAFRGFVEEKCHALAVVSIESGVVQVLAKFRRITETFNELACRISR